MTDVTSENNEVNIDPSEPSMEDILASIRQLIADDDVATNIGDAAEATRDLQTGAVDVNFTHSVDEAPLDLTYPLDDLDVDVLGQLTDTAPVETSISNAISAATDEVRFDVAVPEIEIEAAELMPQVAPDGEIDLPVKSLIDDMMGGVIDAPTDESLDAASQSALNGLMGDIIPEVDEVDSLKNISKLDTGDMAKDVIPSNEDDLGASIDDILNGLSNNIDETTVLDDADVSIETAIVDVVPANIEAVVSPIHTLTDSIETNTSSDDFETLFENDEGELGQDFDELMASFTADDQSEPAADIAPDMGVEPSEITNVPETADLVEAVAANEPPLGGSPVSDAAEGDFDMGSLIDDIMGPDGLDEPSILETPDETTATADVLVDTGAKTDQAMPPADMTAPENSLPENTLDDSDDIDSILAVFDNDMAVPDTAEIDAVDADISESLIAEDIYEPGVEASESGAASDPDIELVKSLMAELTDVPDDVEMAAEAEARATSEFDLEDDILSDLLNDTLESEEDLQANTRTEINHQLDAINGETEPVTSLTALADEMNAEGADIELAREDEPQSNEGGAALAMGSLMAVVAAQSAKPSALDALMSDEGAELEDLPALSDDLSGGDDELVSDNETDALSGLIDDMITQSEANDVAEMRSDEPALDTFDIDNLIDDIVGEDSASSRPEAQTDDENLGDALMGLVDDTSLESAPEIEVVNTDLDFINDILAPEANEALDAAPETLNKIPQPSEMEIEDMAKSARETILDEVTETAAASAFASLNQVVEDKAIVAERGDRIGDLVTAALQPMLKEWLDANLKGIVERAVTKEVKRISSGK